MLKLIPAGYSHEDRLSYIIALAELIPGALALTALVRISYFSDMRIDSISMDLLSAAGILGIPGVIFGGWMCLRRIGRPIFGFMALALGCLGIAAWPIANYLSEFAAMEQLALERETRTPMLERETLAEVEPPSQAPPPFPSAGELLPEEFDGFWEPRFDDLDGIVARRMLRVLVSLGGYQYFFDDGRPRGATLELLQKFEDFLNQRLERRTLRVEVVPVPVSRDQLIRDLVAGYADMVASDLTITPDRSAVLDFTRPLLTNVNEVIVTGPAAPPIGGLEDLQGLEIFVRPSSSYEQHLRALIEQLDADARAPPIIRAVDELLEAEDLMEMVDAGLIPATVMDDYKAIFWSEVFPNVTVREDLIVNEGGSIAWAVRKNNPELKAMLNEFLRKYGRGTLFGNVVYDRYLSNAERVRCAAAGKRSNDVEEMVGLFQKYGELYDFDWLMLAAQAYQESGLRQNRLSGAGAVGIMQVRPSTAADRNVGIEDIDQLENNIHAGAKYMRFLADRYFSENMDPVNRWLFSLAAYNAGPARIARIRREAAQQGHDRNQWFDQVEITAARRIGRETVHYVGNIYKYYVGYSLASAKGETQDALYGTQLGGCVPEAS